MATLSRRQSSRKPSEALALARTVEKIITCGRELRVAVQNEGVWKKGAGLGWFGAQRERSASTVQVFMGAPAWKPRRGRAVSVLLALTCRTHRAVVLQPAPDRTAPHHTTECPARFLPLWPASRPLSHGPPCAAHLLLAALVAVYTGHLQGGRPGRHHPHQHAAQQLDLRGQTTR